MFTGIRHLAHVLSVPPTKACLLCATPAGVDLYIQLYARRHLPSAVPWISEDRLLVQWLADESEMTEFHSPPPLRTEGPMAAEH